MDIDNIITEEYDDEDIYSLVDDEIIDSDIDDVEEYEEDPEYDNEFLSPFDVVAREEVSLQLDYTDSSSRFNKLYENTYKDEGINCIKSPSSMKKFKQFMGVMTHAKD